MKALFPEHLYDNWKEIYALPEGPQKDFDMRVVRRLIKGNLQWMVRQLIGGCPAAGDTPEWCAARIAAGEMLPPDEFTRKRRIDEDRKRKNQQHSEYRES